MAKGKIYGPDFMGRPRIRQSKKSHFEINYDSCSKSRTSGFPPFPGSSRFMTPLETALVQKLFPQPKATHGLPDQMSESDYLPVAVICERLEDQEKIVPELQECFARGYIRLKMSPEKANVRLHFLPIDEMDEAGTRNECSAEELMRLALSEIYETFQEKFVIALTPLSQQMLAILKECADTYPDQGQRFLTLADVLSEEDDSYSPDDISQPDVREHYVNAVVERIYSS